MILLFQSRTVDLLKFGMQIAEAMHTLNQIGFTHRDLAARNCLIYSKTLKIKLSDTGAMNKSYKKEYFQETLPIRWMSFETIINGVCTTKSQVYSFGVTLWEIMKYCQMLPHQFLSDEELLNEIFNTENIDDDCHHLNEDNIDQTDPKVCEFRLQNHHKSINVFFLTFRMITHRHSIIIHSIIQPINGVNG